MVNRFVLLLPPLYLLDNEQIDPIALISGDKTLLVITRRITITININTRS